MDQMVKTFIVLGVLFLLGLATETIGRRTRLPRVTLLLIFGFVMGPAGFKLLSPNDGGVFAAVPNLALVMVGFLLGEKFTISSLRQVGRLVLWISVAEVLVTAIIVWAGLLLLGAPAEIALLLAGISTATAPAATTDVVHESGADGPHTRILLGIVAVDDAWGLIVFSFMLSMAQSLGGMGNSAVPLFMAAWELGGAVLVGIALGIPMAYLTGRIKPGEPTLVEALGVVFLCAGISLWLDVSFLLAAMVLGSVVANLARHHSRPFHAIENIEWPFMILFFVLAGASLHIEALFHVGLIGTGYIVFRVLGRLIGAWAGGTLGHASPEIRKWMGWALMPQAGVALGMALLAVQRLPEVGMTIFPVVIGSTVLFELFGPVLTRSALVHWGEVPTDV